MSTRHEIEMTELKRSLSFLILGQKGGKNRTKIIELLRDRPYNINQLAERLSLNYRTVKHHIDILLKYQIISSSRTGGYGDVYFLSPELEGNILIYDAIVQKVESVKKLANFTDSPLFFRKILQRTFEGVIIVDMDWDVVFWNESAERIFDLKKEDALHNRLDIFVHYDIMDDMIVTLSKDGNIHDLVTSGKNRAGKEIDISILIDPIPQKKMNVGYCIMVRDISETKIIEERLELKRKGLEVIMEHTGTGLAYLDLEFNFINANSIFVKRSGYKRAEIIGKNLFSLFPNEENEALFDLVKSSGKTMDIFDKTFELFKDAKKSVTYWNWTIVPVMDESGNVISFVLNLKETTENVKDIKDVLCLNNKTISRARENNSD